MTKLRYGFEGIAPSGTITAAAVVSDPAGFTAAAVSAGSGTITADTAHVHAGNVAAKVDGVTYSIIRLPFSTAGTGKAISWYQWLPSSMTSAQILGYLSGTSTPIAGTSLTIGAARKLNLNSGAVTSAGVLTLDQWIRFESQLDTVAGTHTVTAYYGDSSTSPAATATLSGLSLASVNATRAEYGVLSGTAITWLDDIQMDDTTTPIGPYIPTVALATPAVTIASQTGPTTIGGSDGTATVTWPAVPNAASYTAHKAAGSSPAQGDFAPVATGVTSPYTFTGLGAGTHALGIRAKA